MSLKAAWSRWRRNGSGAASHGAPREVIVDVAGPPRAQDEFARHALALAEVASGKSRIGRGIEQLRSMSEREILACGRVLSEIVDSVRALMGANERGMLSSQAKSEDLTARFIDEVRKDTLTQESLQRVLHLADGIHQAAADIGNLTQYSNLLAINARIEAARIGEQGRGFAVIAESMRELSNTIRVTAERVGAAVEAMRQGLPEVEEIAASMQRRRESLSELAQQQAEAVGAEKSRRESGATALDRVLLLSNEALSHLQFQDTLSQDLVAIDHRFDVMADRVRRALDGEVLVELAPEAPSAAAHAADAGKVVLF